MSTDRNGSVIMPADQYRKDSNKARADRYKNKFRTEHQVVKHLNQYRDAGHSYAMFSASKSLSYEMLKKLVKNGYKVTRTNGFIKVEWQ